MSRLLLAPMEGVADFVMRDVLTSVGGYDGCVSEFVRVTGSLLPARTYERETPEIRNGGYTASGTPMVIQLLGSDPEWLARNAAQAATVSPHGIDLNFGCPAKVVNRHGGGAMLLATPELLHRIVSTVRAAVPARIAVTAKMRLGVSDTSLAIACATALAEGGAASLVVHARTRDHGYRPPAHWDWIARIADAVRVPVVANGEVWTVDDWARCRAVSGCDDVMIGRGAVSDPFLALRIRGQMARQPSDAEWPLVLGCLADYLKKLRARIAIHHEHGRVKLWLGYLKRTWPQAAELHDAIRRLQDSAEILGVIEHALARIGQQSAPAG
ncbi:MULTISPECIES: tRNA-dihydrouridine synthase [Ralstonia solanacearum species complex]|uniref:tRNA-dihydrouridine(16) synthase n=4 Tax=Ralstonia solanacearum species complex TaxID=3116862 RepID=DUSC_RALN1|nr:MULTISPECIES: tRNA-dihydrouridine synthase [Ralstonia]Q8XYX1.1 RecName: Full=tRNA-dihydrouridine(16) synthase; AltName: Full=U16-specific dihydrouridine synthase; Short=U16-specific Dus; AltName: Full=tRNA-dihydrouridine synthase C [Ralstonia pseudosolanacearum GMI1000]AOE89708.1 tRNA-dihydrouridine(16) synthase [Ralstonia solanacearum]APC68629.1 dihydrouridine synthase [Ralstonia solanacearum OE1-1]APF86871.1 dihydrouridine synthase [Ralstonia solanacearum FJAT-1458]ARS56259.1 dihydrouridi